jgi:hypothetical protein
MALVLVGGVACLHDRRRAHRVCSLTSTSRASVLRVMLHTRWNAEAWLVVRVEFRRALALRSEIRAAGGSSRLVTAPSLCGAVLVRVAAFG